MGIKKIRQFLRVSHAIFLYSLRFVQPPKNKFVVFGQGRTGSTLLMDLLKNSDTHTDREIFNIFHFCGRKISRPIAYVLGRSKRFNKLTYGFKFKIYQLKEDHAIQDVKGFLKSLEEEGFKIIYLKRIHTVEHAISNIRRIKTGVTHSRDGKQASSLFLNSEDFNYLLNEINYRRNYLNEEAEILKNIEHLSICYEQDLLNKSDQLRTVNTVRSYLNLTIIDDVQTVYKKINNKPLHELIENYHELISFLTEHGIQDD